MEVSTHGFICFRHAAFKLEMSTEDVQYGKGVFNAKATHSYKSITVVLVLEYKRNNII